MYLPILERVHKSRRLRSLVLLIDSPGGSAPASEELYRAVAKVAANKPVVAFIRGTGASGAYYVSCAAHRIVAVPNALVGSVGVIFVQPVVQQLFQKLGISVHVQKSGRYKDMYGPFRDPTPEEQAKLQALSDEIYQRFLQVVAQGRRMDPAKVQELATGEVFTAQRAKDLGLVDEVADYDAALEMAAALARIKRREVHLRPRRPFFQRFLGGMAEDMAHTIVAEVETRLMGQWRLGR
jgi:protease-4